jgi:hypothetical protein
MNIEPDHSVDAEDEEAVEFEADDLELEESEVEDPTTVGESRSREAAEAAALGDIFQRVTQLLPSDQDLLKLDAGTSA